MPDSFLAACENFKYQAAYCQKIGSPFYAKLLVELGNLLIQNRDSAIGQVFSNWKGHPKDDAIALRFAAALHYLVITNADLTLRHIFPPNITPDSDRIRAILLRAIERHQDVIIDYLESPPQTNEVGRSQVLLGGFLEIAKNHGPDLDIFEIGASAGLNMAFDQYFYQAKSWQWGEPSSSVHFKPNWTGPPPALGPLNIHSRRACDISPIEAIKEKKRLLSYVWPDQAERLQRINGAIDYTAIFKPEIESTEASRWLLEQDKNTSKVRPRVFYHSIIWQYFSSQQQTDFTAQMNTMGERASKSSPIIWMRLEPAVNKPHAELKYTRWPNKSEHHLADSGFHGEWIRWHGK